MIKYSLILLGLYFLYYAGNILYDLFLRKEKIIHVDLTEEFSLGDFSKTRDQIPTSIGIEDVENIRTPQSFLKRELNLPTQSSSEEQPDLEDLRKRFEAEQDIDDMPLPAKNNSAPAVEERNQPDRANPSQPVSNMSDQDSKSEKKEKTKSHWKELLNLSETTVQMVANYDGQKVYHSII